VTSIDRKILNFVFVLLACAAAFVLVTCIQIALANWALEYPQTSFWRALITSCLDILFGATIISPFFLGGYLWARRRDPERQGFVVPLSYRIALATGVCIGIAIVLVGFALIDWYVPGSTVLTDYSWTTGVNAWIGRQPVWAYSLYIIVCGAISLLVLYLILRFVLTVFANFESYSIIFYALAVAVLIVPLAGYYAFTTQYSFVKPLQGFDILAVYFHNPWPVKPSPKLETLLQKREQVIAQNNKKFGPVTDQRFFHRDTFLRKDNPALPVEMRDVFWYYCDQALQITLLDVPDLMNWHLSPIERNPAYRVAGLYIWSFRLLILLLFAPIASRVFVVVTRSAFAKRAA